MTVQTACLLTLAVLTAPLWLCPGYLLGGALVTMWRALGRLS